MTRLDVMKRSLLVDALRITHWGQGADWGKVKAAADHIGITRQTVWEWIKLYGVTKDEVTRGGIK